MKNLAKIKLWMPNKKKRKKHYQKMNIGIRYKKKSS